MQTKLTLRADRSLIRADAESRRFISVELRAPDAPPRASRLPVNLAFVIDRSGSMHGAKIGHAREAVIAGIRSLRETDRFSVVAFDDDVERVVPATPATAEAREAAVAAVQRVHSRGSTDLHAGWQRGCEQVAESLASDAVGRCLLLTDGLANRGETDPDEIVRQCAGWRDRRVVTTTLGLGEGFDEDLLRRMSDAGGGNFQFIESAAQIVDFMASEVGEALATTVRECVLVVDAGEGAVVESLNDFPCRREAGAWRVAIGSLFGGQLVTPVLRITFPQGAPGDSREVRVRAEDLDGALGGAAASTRFTWAGHAENDAQPRDRVVDRRVAALYAARAERAGHALNRKGGYELARQAVEACAARIRQYAGDDAELLAIVADLGCKARQYGRRMDPLTSKRFYATSSLAMKGRGQDPQSRPPAPLIRGPVRDRVQAIVALVIARLAVASPDLLAGLDVRVLPESLAHRDARGCLFDPSQDSAGEIELRLEAADLCVPCRRAIVAAGVPPERLQRIVEALRLLGTPSGVVH